MQAPPLLEADYVIVGAGATGMAFADTLLSESQATMVIVDRRDRPGGHWNDSYPFIRLHASPNIYGVNALALGGTSIDQVGWNRGLQELPSGAEICAYFDRVMQQRLLPGGRVRFLPRCELDVGSGEARSLVSGERWQLRARRKWVDAHLADTELPSTHGPRFAVADGVRLVSPSGLVQLREPAAGHVIIGAGKTAIDTALWLLEHGVAPPSITWIRPRDAWLLNRANVQYGEASFARMMAAAAGEMEAARDAASVADLFRRLESEALLQRIDPGVVPTMFRCAVVSNDELVQLRRIERVVRLGHVVAIERGRIVLQRGVIATSPAHVHIHCSAAGLPRGPEQPVFQGNRILPQYVRRCSPSFSAAFVAWLEANLGDDADRNALCLPVAPPNVPLDWLRMHLRGAANQQAWAGVPGLHAWLCGARLDAVVGMIARVQKDADAADLAALDRYRRARRSGLARLEELLASPAAAEAAARTMVPEPTASNAA